MVPSGVRQSHCRPSPLLRHVARHTNSSLSLQPSFTSRHCLYPRPGASFLAGSSVKGQKLNQAPRQREQNQSAGSERLTLQQITQKKARVPVCPLFYSTVAFSVSFQLHPGQEEAGLQGVLEEFPHSMLMKPKQITTRNHLVRLN